MKRKLNKKSALGNTLKAIPLALALTLFTSGNVFAAQGGTIVVEVNGRKVTFDVNLLGNERYRQEALAYLRGAWESADPIYYSQDGKHFADFSKTAEPGITLTDVLNIAERKGETFDLSATEEIPMLTMEDLTIY